MVDAIALAYSSRDTECPIGVKAHLTRAVTSLWVWTKGVVKYLYCSWMVFAEYLRQILQFGHYPYSSYHRPPHRPGLAVHMLVVLSYYMYAFDMTIMS